MLNKRDPRKAAIKGREAKKLRDQSTREIVRKVLDVPSMVVT